MSNSSRLNVHLGEALFRLAATYPTILLVVLEQVQNSLDAHAKNIWIVLNHKTRHIAIRDDGDGATREKFEKALQEVCHTQKAVGDLGRFGIGLISPVGKCKYSTFTSTAPGENSKFLEWTFETKAIRSQGSDVGVPLRERPDLYYIKSKTAAAPKGVTTVMWRTEVNIYEFSDDKYISRIGSIDALADAVTERYGYKMRRNDVSLHIKFGDEKGGQMEVREGIKAKLFTGRPLGKQTLFELGAGAVIFNMFMAQKTTKGLHGRVLVGETDDDFRFGFNLIARHADGLISKAAIDGLNSGIFEGEITSKFVKLHATRQMFEKDDAFIAFCKAIDEWFERHGAAQLEAVKETRREQRLQDLALQSLRQLEEMLKTPEFAELRNVFKTFKLGSVGEGHAPLPDSKIVKKQEEKSVAVTGGITAGRSGGKSVNDIPKAPRESHHPLTAAGPKGKQRDLTRKDSVGLQISHIPIDGWDGLWKLDIREGVLHFNTNHPAFVMCEASDRKLMQLHETVIINALMIEVMPPEYSDVLKFHFDESLPMLLHMYHTSPSFNPLKKKSIELDE